MDLLVIDEISPDNDKNEILGKYIKNDVLDLEIQFKSDFKNTKMLREFIETAFSMFNIKDLWKSRFILISDELNNNAIEYWSLENELNKLVLKMQKTSSWVSVNLEVIDTGNWQASKKSHMMYELGRAKLENWFDDHKWIRWRWLFQIIHKIVDDLYFKDSNSWWLIVWVRKDLKNEIDIN